MTFWREYPTKLEEVKPGRPFFMLNYEGLFPEDYLFLKGNWSKEPRPINDDGVHLPVVNLTTGSLFWMAKEKPCRVT